MMSRPVIALLFLSSFCLAQTPKDVRAVAKQGQNAIPTVGQYLNSASVDTRIEAVKQLIVLGGKDTIDPLIRGTRDSDAEVQIRATDGLVNYYLPGYVKTGLGSSVIRAGASIKSKFSDSNDQVIDPFVVVRPDVIAALGQLARSGADLSARANACRAIGVLRGGAAIPDLVAALRTKDNNVMYESLAAIEKIRDPSAGPQIVYLLRDLDDRVQSTAIETVGVLRTKEALPSLRSIVNSPRNNKSERAALGALAMMPDPADHDLLTRELGAKDDKLRADAAEGLGAEGDLPRHGDRPGVRHIYAQPDEASPLHAAGVSVHGPAAGGLVGRGAGSSVPMGRAGDGRLRDRVGADRLSAHPPVFYLAGIVRAGVALPDGADGDGGGGLFRAEHGVAFPQANRRIRYIDEREGGEALDATPGPAGLRGAGGRIADRLQETRSRVEDRDGARLECGQCPVCKPCGGN